MSEREVEFGWDVGNGTRYEVKGVVSSVSYDNGFSSASGNITITLCGADVQVRTVPIRQKEVPVTYKDDQVIVHCKSGQRYVYLGRCDAPYEDEALVPKRGHTLRAEGSRFLYYIADEMLTHYRLPEPKLGDRFTSNQNGLMVYVLGVDGGYVVFGHHLETNDPMVHTVFKFHAKYTQKA